MRLQPDLWRRNSRYAWGPTDPVGCLRRGEVEGLYIRARVNHQYLLNTLVDSGARRYLINEPRGRRRLELGLYNNQ